MDSGFFFPSFLKALTLCFLPMAFWNYSQQKSPVNTYKRRVRKWDSKREEERNLTRTQSQLKAESWIFARSSVVTCILLFWFIRWVFISDFLEKCNICLLNGGFSCFGEWVTWLVEDSIVDCFAYVFCMYRSEETEECGGGCCRYFHTNLYDRWRWCWSAENMVVMEEI